MVRSAHGEAFLPATNDCYIADMEPLQRPICFRCRDPAINCTCDLKSGRELILPLVHKSEPSSREEGLDLWAIYLDRHPAMHDIDPKRFVADFKKNGFLQALDQVL